jgi:hypothetical protein
MATVRHLGLFAGGCPTPVNTQEQVGISLNTWMTLEEIMAFVWRVKSWKIIHESSVNPNGDNEYALNFEGVIRNTRNDWRYTDPVGERIELDNEGQLVCGSYFSAGELLDNCEGSCEYGWFQSHSYLASSIKYHKATGTFRPLIEVGMFNFIFVQMSPAPPSYYLDLFGEDSGYASPGQVGQARLQIGSVGYDESFPVYGHAFDGGAASAAGSFNHVVSAEEYWPYDPEDGGGPIYDSVTGAQLRDFPAS